MTNKTDSLSIDMWKIPEFQDSDSNSEYPPPIILDIGTHSIKAGCSGNMMPTIITPTNGAVERGVVTDWDEMESLLTKILRDELLCEMFVQPILIAEAPLNPRKNREKIAQLMFEKFDFSGVYFAIPAVLSMYAYRGQLTGVVMDSGEGVTHVVSMYEGHSLSDAIQRIDFGGADVTAELKSKLNPIYHNFSSFIKENHCCVEVERHEDTPEHIVGKSFRLPDGSDAVLGRERFACTEIMFDTAGGGVDFPQILYDSIMKCDIDIRDDIASNIKLSGGNMLFEGMSETLQSRLNSLCSENFSLRVFGGNVCKRSEISAWFGGSILADMSTMKEMWVMKEKYEECGDNVLFHC